MLVSHCNEDRWEQSCLRIVWDEINNDGELGRYRHIETMGTWQSTLRWGFAEHGDKVMSAFRWEKQNIKVEIYERRSASISLLGDNGQYWWSSLQIKICWRHIKSSLKIGNQKTLLSIRMTQWLFSWDDWPSLRDHSIFLISRRRNTSVH